MIAPPDSTPPDSTPPDSTPPDGSVPGLLPMTAAQRQEYTALLHAMQTGVAYMMHHSPAIAEPKHLRVGIDSSLVSNAALVRLLVERGLLTSADYYEHLLDETRREVQRVEASLARATGIKITLL